MTSPAFHAPPTSHRAFSPTSHRAFSAAGPLLRLSPRGHARRALSIRAAAAPDKVAVAALEKQGLAASEAWDTVVTDFLDPGRLYVFTSHLFSFSLSQCQCACVFILCVFKHMSGLAAAATTLLQDRADIGFVKVGGYASASRVRFVFTNPELLESLGTADDLAAEHTVTLSVSVAFDKAGNRLGAGGNPSQKSARCVVALPSKSRLDVRGHSSVRIPPLVDNLQDRRFPICWRASALNLSRSATCCMRKAKTERTIWRISCVHLRSGKPLRGSCPNRSGGRSLGLLNPGMSQRARLWSSL